MTKIIVYLKKQNNNINNKDILNISYGLTIEFMASSYDVGDDYQELIISDFNRYAKEHHLDINIHRTVLSYVNSSVYMEDFANYIESILHKNSIDYDIILIDHIYVNRFANYAADLSQYMSKEVLDQYASGIAPKIGYVGDKLVTMVSFKFIYLFIYIYKMKNVI